MPFQKGLGRGCKLPLLGPAKLRLAQLGNVFPVDSACNFAPANWRRLDDWAPNVLIGTAADLGRLSERLDLGTVQLGALDHSIFVVTAVGDRPLSGWQRSALWQRFEVPVYEVFIDHARLLAYECEAHNGWHVQPGASFHLNGAELSFIDARAGSVPTGLRRYLDTRPCACGRVGARLVEELDWDPSCSSEPEPHLAAIA